MTHTPDMMVLLFSNYSEACKKFRQAFDDKQLELFKPVCVDSQIIRDLVLESTNIIIEHVPCILLKFPDGVVAKYEADDAFNLIINMSKSSTDHKRVNPDGSLPTSRIDSLINMPDTPHQYPQQEVESIRGMQGKKPQSIHIASRDADVPLNRKRDMSPEIDILSDRGIHSGGDFRPVRGEGHSGMRASSLPDMQAGEEYDEQDEYEENIQEPITRTVQIGKGKNIKIIEDLTPDDIEPDDGGFGAESDPSGMGVPRTDTIPISGKSAPVPGGGQPIGQMGKRSHEKSSAIKNMASAIAAARENEEAKLGASRQATDKVKRHAAKK